MENVTIIAIILFTLVGSGVLIHTVAHKLNQWFPTNDDPYTLRPTNASATSPRGVGVELQVTVPRPPRLARRDGEQIPRRDPPEYDCEAGLEHPPPVYSVELGEHDRVILQRSA